MKLAANALTISGVSTTWSDVQTHFQHHPTMILDLSAVENIDSAGIAFLHRLVQVAQQKKRKVCIVNVPNYIEKTLTQITYVAQHPHTPTRQQTSWYAGIDKWLIQIWHVALAYLLLCTDILEGMWQNWKSRRAIRPQALTLEMIRMGSSAWVVVSLISLLVGMTIALQSASQLREFGANIFVADLIGVSITRELGPLMAAIIVAGRSGSAIASEISTMVIMEEIDALKTMGINPIRFIVLPKVYAMAMTQPLLTIWANVVAIVGGLIVAVWYLDVATVAFLERLQAAVYFKDLFTGLIKAWIFAYLIVSVGVMCGLRTRGGADAVGETTTRSVVAAIFAIVVADTACSLLFYFGE